MKVCETVIIKRLLTAQFNISCIQCNPVTNGSTGSPQTTCAHKLCPTQCSWTYRFSYTYEQGKVMFGNGKAAAIW